MLAAKSGESSFLNAAGDFLERVGAADGADVFVEELIGRRKDGFGLAGPGAFCRFAFQFFRSDDRCGNRLSRAAMAGVAGDFAMAFEVLFVDGHHHANHFARRDFWLLVICFERASDVTVFAFDTQRGGDKLHGRDHLIGWNSF